MSDTGNSNIRYICEYHEPGKEHSFNVEGPSEQEAAWNAAQELFGKRYTLTGGIEKTPAGWWQAKGKLRSAGRDTKDDLVGKPFKLVEKVR